MINLSLQINKYPQWYSIYTYSLNTTSDGRDSASASQCTVP